MNTIHNNGENDQSVNDGLDKLSNAYGQLQNEEPPELLDQAILNSAHRAVESKPHWMQFGWLHGLTTAAVFVLALSLIFHTREPVPDYENGMRANEASGLIREKAAKKQSGEVKSDDLRMEMKEENENRQAVIQSAPAPAAPPGAAMEITVGDQAAETAAGAQRSLYAQEDLKLKTDHADKDVSSNEPVLEEVLSDEADPLARAQGLDIISKQSRPAAAVITPPGATKAPVEIDAEAEQRLLNIINLKKAGDETWKAELASFKLDHPDYPLPEELLN